MNSLAHRLLYFLYIATALPFLYISVMDVYFEWEFVLEGSSGDVPHYGGMAAMVNIVIPFALMGLLIAVLLSVYIWRSGSINVRRHISFWFGILCLVIVLDIYGPHASQFSQRVYFSLYQLLTILPLVALPLFWIIKPTRAH